MAPAIATVTLVGVMGGGGEVADTFGASSPDPPTSRASLLDGHTDLALATGTTPLDGSVVSAAPLQRPGRKVEILING